MSAAFSLTERSGDMYFTPSHSGGFCEINAPAKINLYLDVTGKRADGYHLLETVMHTISLSDSVTLTELDSGGIQIHCSDPLIPRDERNIAYKCARAFLDKTGKQLGGVGIEIVKNIPSQAGMGGGSADGAAVLKGLNKLLGTGLSDDELIAIGTPIGADIPFCIKGGCGWCTGIGEIIEPLPELSGTVLIAKGQKGISTAEAFGRIDSVGQKIGLKDVRESFLRASSAVEISDLCRNIFDEVTNCDEVSEIKRIMTENGAECACMTGSGSAVFGIFRADEKAEAVRMELDKMGFYAAVCSLI